MHPYGKLLLCAGMLLVSPSLASAVGVFTAGSFTTDASAGISSLKTYHSLANFGETTNVTVTDDVTGNPVVFPSFNGGATITGTNFTLEGANNDRTDDGDAVPANVTGEAGDLLNEFVYGTADLDADPLTEPTSRLTLTNLAVGTPYVTTFYTAAFGGVGGRITNITTSDGGVTVYDENATAATNTGGLLRYAFVAEGTSLSFDFDPLSNNDTFHHYAFSNEVVPEPATLGLLSLGGFGLLARRRRSV